MHFNQKQLLEEVNYKAVLSGGPGGQHANKANTKVILEWDLKQTSVFDEDQIERLKKKLQSYLTKDNVFQMSSNESRSQHRNKDMVTQRFLNQLKTALKKRKKRKKPKPGKKYHEKRLQEKKRTAEKKANRKDPLL
ncbi:MAG TPA: peptide chain release factor-like protein [Flavobacteriaceae bacterium]|nr:peptide chain release factor-like protein [Flavobacteriaceae bacterium]